MATRAERFETVAPFVIVFVWWVAMYPGLFGEDSLMALDEVTRGPQTAWFTAWWIEIIRMLSLGGRWFSLVTLMSAAALAWGTTVWIRACLPPGRTRAWVLCLLCATPLIGALGIQLRHDSAMTAGLLLWTAVTTRTRWLAAKLVARDYWQLLAAALLLATRHNGLPTVVLAGAIAFISPGSLPRRAVLTMIAAFLAIALWTEATTRWAGLERSVEPVQAIEWTLSDLSCLLARPSPAVSSQDWAVLERFASRADWPSAAACRFLNPLTAAPTFDRQAATRDYPAVLGVWLSIAAKNPWMLTRVHFERARLFLPPLVGGLPVAGDTLPFIHSTILPNELGVRWAFPRIAGVFRMVIRAWNAARLVLGHVGLWLIVLVICAVVRRRDPSVHLWPTVIVAIALDALLIATAPISEARYGLFILICGQAVGLIACLEAFVRRPIS